MTPKAKNGYRLNILGLTEDSWTRLFCYFLDNLNRSLAEILVPFYRKHIVLHYETYEIDAFKRGTS